MNKKKIIYEIIKIVCTAIISITAVLTAQSCTMSLSVSKNNSNSTQKTEQTTTSSVDSTQINIDQKNKNHGLKRSIQNQEKKTQRQMRLSLLLVITWLLSKCLNRKKKLKK